MHKALFPFHPLVNFRDMGGIVMKDGRRVKPGLFFRSGGLYKMTDEELEALCALNIRSIMDFRTKMESDQHPDPRITGAVMIRHSGIEFRNATEIDFSPDGMRQIGAEGERQIEVLKGYYKEIPYDNEALREFFTKIREGAVPIVFHCASGKDRTGVAAMLLLFLLGADKETALADYLLSNEYLREDLEREYATHADQLPRHPELKELLTMLAGVSEDVGRYVLKEFASRFPRTEDYFIAEYGMDDAEIARLRDAYLE